MPEAPDGRQYERVPTRVRAGSGRAWLAVWVATGVAVISIGVGGSLLSRPADERRVGVAPNGEAAAQPVARTPRPSGRSPAPSDATRGAPPLDITSGASGYAAAFDARRRRSTPLVVESTDFHANAGAAYYGIGGRLIRALAPVPTRTPNPGDAPE